MKDLAKKIESKELAEKVIAVACHPGFANTNLHNAAKDSMTNWEKMDAGNAQSAADGSLPLVMSTIGSEVKKDDYVGPSGGMTGPPKVTKVGGNGNDMQMPSDIWKYSEECIKENFEI